VTVGEIRCSLAVMLAISTSPSSVQNAHFVVPEFFPCPTSARSAPPPAPSTVSGNGWRFVDVQRRDRQVPALRGAPRAFRSVPRRRGRRIPHAGSGAVDSALPAAMSSPDPLGDLLPARRPCHSSNGPLLRSEAPAHREVDLARGVGDVLQVHGGVVERVAQDGPQETAPAGWWIRGSSFRRSAAGLLEDAVDDRVGLGAACHVGAAGGVEALDLLADLLVEAGAGLLAQRALLDQAGPTNGGRRVAGEERIVGQVVLQRLDERGAIVSRPTTSAGAERAPSSRRPQLLCRSGRRPRVVRQAELSRLR